MCCLMEEEIRELRHRVDELEALLAKLGHETKDAATAREYDRLRRQYGAMMTKTQAANELGVTRATVYAMIRDGRLKERACDRRIDAMYIARRLTDA